MNVTAIWRAALADSGLVVGSVELRLSHDSLPTGMSARYLRESRRIEVDVVGRSEVLVAALIRHELQHLVQLDACPDLGDLTGSPRGSPAR